MNIDERTRVHRECGLLEGMFWITYCFSFGFFVAYLNTVGYSAGIIGIFIAILALNAIVAQPIFGYIIDKVADVKKILIICVSASIILVAAIPFLAKNMAVMVVVCVLLGWTEYGLGSVVDCWCIKLGKNVNANFGVGRAGGSFAYAVTAAAFGYLFNFIPIHYTFFLHGGAALIFLLVIIKSNGTTPVKADLQDNKEKKKENILKVLLSDRRYVVFVLCASMTFIGSAATASFLINLIESKGGTTEHLGYALCIQALFEIPAMLLSLKLFKRFNVRFLLIFSMTAYIFKFLLPVFSPSPFGIVAIMMIQGISFAIFLPAAMRYLAIVAPPQYNATAITLAVAVYSGMGNIFGNLLGGFIADSLGVEWIYYLSGGLAALAVFLFIALGREKRVAESVNI